MKIEMGYIVSRTPITDSDKTLQPITQIGQPTSKCKQKKIQTKETQGIYKKAQGVATKVIRLIAQYL